MQSLIDKLKTGDGAIAAMLWIGIGLVLLIVVVVFAAWLIRVLRPTLNMSGAPSRAGRVQRLAVTDAFPLDREGRKLVIVRRDNIEHLLLIGGPNDLLIEANFMRSDRARSAKPDGLSESAEAAVDAAILAPPANQRPQAPAPVVSSSLAPPPAPPMRQAPLPRTPVAAPAPPASAAPVQALAKPAIEPPPVPRSQPEPVSAPKPAEFDLEFEQAMRAIEAQVPIPPRTVAPQPTPQPPAQQARPSMPSAPRTEPMSEMARRLSEVLQKPIAPQRPATSAQPRPPMPPIMPAATPTAAATPSTVPASSNPASSKPSTEVEMDLLEEEMARLLGRPVTPVKPGGA